MDISAFRDHHVIILNAIILIGTDQVYINAPNVDGLTIDRTIH